jgi:hypothetical protein
MSARLQAVGKFAAKALPLVAGALLLGWIIRGDDPKAFGVRSDTPPPDYLYIDTTRVLSYLGQIETGLAAQEKRSRSAERGTELEGGAAGIKGTASEKTSESVEVQVEPTAADRFYELLPKLIAGRTKKAERPWLHDVSALANPKYRLAKHAAALCRVHEGDFVRIENAHLFLPPYAAILPKVRFAQRTVRTEPDPGLRARTPKPRANSAASAKIQPAIAAYEKALGDNARLPFVVPTLAADPKAQPHGVSFFIPARYNWLADEPSLLSGSLTVVGKVTFRDLRVPGRTICDRSASEAARPNYFDQQTLLTFAPALQATTDKLLASVGIWRQKLVSSVRDSVTFNTPMMVVVPLAIYQ